MVGADHKDSYVGNDAISKRGTLRLTYPIGSQGVVTNWDDMEKIWHHTIYNELRASPDEQPILMTEHPKTPKAVRLVDTRADPVQIDLPVEQREQTVQYLFDCFSVPCCYIAINAVLALYSSGRTTGVVVSSGDAISTAVPIYEGYSLPHAVSIIDVGGKDVTGRLTRLLTHESINKPDCAEHGIVCDIKEKVCYTAIDLKAERRRGLLFFSLH